MEGVALPIGLATENGVRLSKAVLISLVVVGMSIPVVIEGAG